MPTGPSRHIPSPILGRSLHAHRLAEEATCHDLPGLGARTITTSRLEPCACKPSISRILSQRPGNRREGGTLLRRATGLPDFFRRSRLVRTKCLELRVNSGSAKRTGKRAGSAGHAKVSVPGSPIPPRWPPRRRKRSEPSSRSSVFAFDECHKRLVMLARTWSTATLTVVYDCLFT